MIRPRLPRPATSQAGTVITDAPGVYDGWARQCLSCGCSVDSQHVAGSDECQMLQDERAEARRADR